MAKIHIKNQLKGKIELCAGMKEYELESEQQVTIEVSDEDVIYLDTLIQEEFIPVKVKALIDAAKRVLKYRGMEEYIDLHLAIQAMEVSGDKVTT